MELTLTNNENDFDPTPELKSSPKPIKFIPFKYVDECHCGNEYSWTVLFEQEYCKNCLSKYISCITDNNTYLDVHIVTNDTYCNKHEARNADFCTQDIQEWCETCSDILYFNQVQNNFYNRHLHEKYLKIFEN